MTSKLINPSDAPQQLTANPLYESIEVCELTTNASKLSIVNASSVEQPHMS